MSDQTVRPRHHLLWLGTSSAATLLLSYSLITFLIGTGDAILSYVAPVFIESFVGNSFFMGLILGFSSLVGILCDLGFAQLLHGRSYRFFLFWTFIVAFLFPSLFIFLPPWIGIFLLAMAAWGIYYELLHFSHFHFVNAAVKREDHALAWGMIESFRSAAYLLGPLIATQLLDSAFHVPFLSSIGFFASAFFGFFLFIKMQKARAASSQTELPRRRSLVGEMRIWGTFMRRVWPLFLFLTVCGFVDATFWSVGTLLSEEIRSYSVFGGFLLTAYMLPSTFVGFVAGPAAQRFGKKRAALYSAVVAGVILALAGFVHHPFFLLVMIFLFALFFALTFPEIFAAFEDYVERLGEFGNDMVGLQASAISFSYIVGPIGAGAIAAVFGNRGSFVFAGVLLVAVSVMALLVLPRKVRMPQAELEALSTGGE